eukprot:3940317-Rhodomonas_salina.4
MSHQADQLAEKFCRKLPNWERSREQILITCCCPLMRFSAPGIPIPLFVKQSRSHDADEAQPAALLIQTLRRKYYNLDFEETHSKAHPKRH